MNLRWIDRRALLLHGERLAEHGGSAGLRDDNLLESALARPNNLVLFGKPDFADLAAGYGLGLAKNHAFVDGKNVLQFWQSDFFCTSTAIAFKPVKRKLR